MHPPPGTWYRWLDFMANVAVITNMATVVFVTNNNPFVVSFAEEHPVWTFLILEVRYSHCRCHRSPATDTPSVPRRALHVHDRSALRVPSQVGDEPLRGRHSRRCHTTVAASGVWVWV